ncbi:single-stranded DNA-binding protein [Arthrobacter sp. EPSL27]|uniref:single-stranded DNA-binding protein n=1 Tax=Arthrobacter sp. EPSL27 TaxID=1745378 RepID=UPI00074A0560|nr:single-stranded DNA-binding protein [Arthrobacter sp. EPSL27]KUM32834.1 single-stranded DNA-binding protein [Arthrobacter sp. EPSL27]
MRDSITVRGFVATDVKSSTTPGGVATAWFRLGSTGQRFDRSTNTWVDLPINWFTVQGYRQLAGNMGCSIKKGQRLIVVGRLKMRSWEKDGREHHVAEIDAESVGHDLMWGSANFIRAAANGPTDASAAAGPPEGSMDGGREGSPEDGYPYDGPDDDEHQSESRTVFVNDATGDVEELDEETGELKGTAA